MCMEEATSQDRQPERGGAGSDLPPGAVSERFSMWPRRGPSSQYMPFTLELTTTEERAEWLERRGVHQSQGPSVDLGQGVQGA